MPPAIARLGEPVLNSPEADLSAESLPELEALYNQGRYVSCHALAVERHGPLQGWCGGVRALVFGSRLAANLGGERLSHALALRANRRAHADHAASQDERASAALFHAYRVLGRRGPLAARRFLDRERVDRAIAAGGTPEVRASICALRAQIAAAFRDVDAAEDHWRRAQALDPSAWIYAQRTALLIQADLYAEALEASCEALRLQPWHRPAVQYSAQALSLLGRDEEALALLTAALDPSVGALESPAIAGQLATLLAELERPEEVLRALDRCEALSPLAEESGRQWLASQRAEALLQLGDLAGSAAAAEPLMAASFFYRQTVPRLREPGRQSARRVLHAVPFVRQHERTCAPATLAALTRFWNRPADQAAIAAEICYGGTFDHQERHWAGAHGWTAREFRIDWPGAVALIDAGIPFTVATTGINSGHLQAVIGYDARRGTLIIRDPYDRNQTIALAEEFVALHAPSGPRGLAIVPADDPAAVARLEAISLPESALYDGVYRLRCALHGHDRPAAQEALDGLISLDPAARLALAARRELALYDGDDPSLLAAVEALLGLFPRDGRLRLEKLSVLRRLARPLEARAWLETCAAEPAETEPNLWRELARELFPDARQHPRAHLLLARSLFHEPTEPEHLRALGELRWAERNFTEAAALLRFASTAAMTREDCWQQYFVASRHLHPNEDAIRLLEARFRRLGDLSSQPARTLHWARRERHEFAAAARVLEEALRRRPADSDLLLFAGSVCAQDGEHAAAADFLGQAKDHVSPGVYARAAAEAAGWAGDSQGALTQWQAVLEREPLDAAAHGAVARLLAELDPRGPAAAREHLAAAVARFPHAVALHQLRVGALAEEPGRGTREHMDAAAALLAVQPANVWAWRERALGFQTLGELPAAFAAVEQAHCLDPLAPSTHTLRGRLFLIAGDASEARRHLRRALELDPNLEGALNALIESSPTFADKRESLTFAHDLLATRPWVSDAINAYRQAAYPILAEPELLGQLEAILEARPDLWQARSAMVWQHANAGRLAPAREHAAAAAEHFPLLPSVWIDLAAVERLRGDDAAEVAALERALRIRTAHGDASRRLAVAHRRAGRFAEARAVLEKAIAAAPLDVANRATQAETLWLEDRGRNGAEALALLVDAVTREPGYVWAWEALDRYADAMGVASPAEPTARALAASRPGEARSWLRLASVLKGDAGPELAERLSALDRAVSLNPRLDEAHDLRARALTAAGRFDEALASCEPSGDIYPGNTRPLTLDARAAWVLACRGDLAGARRRLRGVLADHPGYEDGWRMLAEWAEEAQNFPEALEAAERLAFLSPHSAMSMGYLASARLRLGQRTGAKEAFREAMRREPAYLYAPATLLELEMDDREWSGAETTLRFLEIHHPGPSTLSRTVALAARRRKKGRALAALAQLLQHGPVADPQKDALPAAVHSMEEAGWTKDAEECVATAWLAPLDANPEAGPVLVYLRTSVWQRWRLGAQIRRLPEGEFARRARIEFLSELVRRRRPGSSFFLWKMRRQLRADTESWGQTGFVLTSWRYHLAAICWMKDWKTRPDAQGWMLFNLAASLRAVSRFAAALRVNRVALTRPTDHTRLNHLAWVTLDDALTDGEDARQRATRQHEELTARKEALEQPVRYLTALAGQVLAVRRATDPDGRRAAYRVARNTLRQERALTFPRSAAVSHMERRTQRRLAQDAGSWRDRLWIGLFSRPLTPLGQMVFLVGWMIIAPFIGGLALVLLSRWYYL